MNCTHDALAGCSACLAASHAELLAALRWALERIGWDYPDFTGYLADWDRAKSAIARAEALGAGHGE